MGKKIEEEHVVTPEAIVLLKERFNADFEKNKVSYDMHFCDLVLADDDLLKRFLWNNHSNIEKSFEQFHSTCKWRKEFGVSELKLSELNKEILSTGALYENKTDNKGNILLMLAVNRIVRNTEKNLDKERLVVWLIEDLFKKSDTRRGTFCIDCCGVGISNMDLDMMVFLVSCILKNYPDCLENILVYEMPVLFNVIWQVIKAMLPKHYKRKVKFVDKKTISEYIPICNLPKRMGGEVLDFFDYETMKFTELKNDKKIEQAV